MIAESFSLVRSTCNEIVVYNDGFGSICLPFEILNTMWILDVGVDWNTALEPQYSFRNHSRTVLDTDPYFIEQKVLHGFLIIVSPFVFNSSLGPPIEESSSALGALHVDHARIEVPHMRLD